ncbi:lipase family alpha/beta hydrolase [Sulfitobacter sp. SH24]|uniref:lipase family alpha/beta hydrolase n=1 Tax=Sulfitobacter sp. SH24 TaxID=3421173 RepID=UPI003F502A03
MKNYTFIALMFVSILCFGPVHAQSKELSGFSPSPKPIVFVPGVMGSRLFRGKEEIWGLFPFEAKSVIYDPEEEIRTEVLDSISFLGATMRDWAYGPFMIEQKESFTTDLYTFSYDWRASNRVSAESLNKYLCSETNLHSEPVVLVAHSMGGLVFKHWVLDFYGKPCPNSGAVINFDRVIFVGTPHLGAPSAFLSMIYSVDLFGQNAISRQLLDNFNAFGSSFDSIYELLPFATVHDGSNRSRGKTCFDDPLSEHGLPTGIKGPRVFWREKDGALYAFDPFNARFLSKLGMMDKIRRLQIASPHLVPNLERYLEEKLDSALENTCRLASFELPIDLKDKVLYFVGSIKSRGVSIDSTVTSVTLSAQRRGDAAYFSTYELEEQDSTIFIETTMSSGDQTVPVGIASNGVIQGAGVRSSDASHLGLLSHGTLGELIRRAITSRKADSSGTMSGKDFAFMFEDPELAISVAGGWANSSADYAYLEQSSEIQKEAVIGDKGLILEGIRGGFRVSERAATGDVGGVLSAGLVEELLNGGLSSPEEALKFVYENPTAENWHLVASLEEFDNSVRASAAVEAGALYLADNRSDEAKLVYDYFLGDSSQTGLIENVTDDENLLKAAMTGSTIASSYAGPDQFLMAGGSTIKVLDAASPQFYGSEESEIIDAISAAIRNNSGKEVPEFKGFLLDFPSLD